MLSLHSKMFSVIGEYYILGIVQDFEARVMTKTNTVSAVFYML